MDIFVGVAVLVAIICWSAIAERRYDRWQAAMEKQRQEAIDAANAARARAEERRAAARREAVAEYERLSAEVASDPRFERILGPFRDSGDEIDKIIYDRFLAEEVWRLHGEWRPPAN